MHKLESFALSCGAKISSPFIYTSFFPMPLEEYITFHTDLSEESKKYSYFQDVINILNPFLSKNGISIVQVGEVRNEAYADCVNLSGQMTQNQQAFIIKNSLLHFGVGGLQIQMASHFDVPLVGIYCNSAAEYNGPFFGSPEKQKLISAYKKLNLKPSYSPTEEPKTINSIYPEEIAQAVLDLLKIEVKVPFETVFIGRKYSNYLIQESIPNTPTTQLNLNEQVELRADIDYNENCFFSQLSQCKKAIIVLDKPININLLNRFKNNISMLVFKVFDKSHRQFLDALIGLGKQLVLISSLPKEKIQELKIHYYDLGNINQIETAPQEKIDELKKIAHLLYYRSAKITCSGNKYYYSLASMEKGLPMQNHHEYQKVVDSPSFWENLDCFTLVKLLDFVPKQG